MWKYTSLKTPIGEIYLTGEDGELDHIYLPGQVPALLNTHWEKDDGAFCMACRQLEAYFSGAQREFSIPYRLNLSEFRQRVLGEVTKIPFGETRTYQEIANRLGNPKAVRAVGAANGKNPLPIVIPCHRVVGSSQQLVGYSGGLKLKKFLLEFESRQFQLF